MSGKSKIIIGLIILALIGGYLYSLYLPGKIEREAHFALPTYEKKPLTGELTSVASDTRKAWTQPFSTAGWNTYRNEAYGFTFQYPPVFKVIGGYEGWPDAIILLECADQQCQTYKLAVQVSDTNRIREDDFKHVFVGKVFGDKYITLTNINNEEAISQVISTFKSF